MNTIQEALNRRYATKAYDATKKVSDEDLHTILEAMRLTPSSFGLQPWKFIVVTDVAIREQLTEASRWQPQVRDASHLIVLASKKDMTSKDVEQYLQEITTKRNIPLESLDGFKNMLFGYISTLDQPTRKNRNTKQTYIALWFWLLAAAELWIDATPMEGFDSSKFDELLWLTDYSTSVIMPIWYRSSEDASQHYAKVRFTAEQVIEYK